MISEKVKQQLLTEITYVLDKWDGPYIGKPENTYICSEMLDRNFECIDCPNNWVVSYGATKLVLINDKYDYVVKIPFFGYAESKNDYIDNRFNVIDTDGWSTERFDEEIKQLKDEYYNLDFGEIFTYYDGSGDNTGYDYCDYELMIYNWAVEEDVSEFFAESDYLGDYHGYPLYIQKKCEIEFFSPTHTSSEESRQKTNSTIAEHNLWNYANKLSLNWLALAQEAYGEDKLVAFLHFLHEYDINDLHSENRGFCDGKVILVDYSGFNS